MSEPTTQCVDCGCSILQSTADKRYGRCVICHHEAANTPPPGFEMPRDVADRLVAMNENPRDFLQRVWQWVRRHSVDSLHQYIDQLEERNHLYRGWLPRLRAFAHECRLELPPPLEDSLSNRERAKQEIYKAMLNKPRVGRMTAAICSMPLIAIPIAQRLWAGEDDRVVLLTPAERLQWGKVCSPPNSGRLSVV